MKYSYNVNRKMAKFSISLYNYRHEKFIMHHMSTTESCISRIKLLNQRITVETEIDMHLKVQQNAMYLKEKHSEIGTV